VAAPREELPVSSSIATGGVVSPGFFGGAKDRIASGLVAILVGSLSVGILVPPRMNASAAPAAVCVVEQARCDFVSIQSAIDAASEGQTIQVGSGTYFEELSISKDGISLLGAGQEQTIIAPSRNYATNNRGLSLRNASGVTLRDFTIDGSGNTSLSPGENFHDGIWWEGGGDNVTIQRVTVKNIDRRAISVFPETVKGTLISSVTVSNVSGARSEPASNGGQGGEGIKMNGTGTVENSEVSGARNSINGNVRGDGSAPVRIVNNVVRDIRPALSSGNRFSIGVNFWLQDRGIPIVVSGNTISGTNDGGSGIYLVQPGSGSLIADNSIRFTGERGVGIETGWSPNGGVTIRNNTISMGPGSTGIIITGSGVSDAPITVTENNVFNTSTDGLKSNDYSTFGFATAREVGLLLSSAPITSRTGDTTGGLHADVRGNSISGFTESIVGLKGTPWATPACTSNIPLRVTAARDFRVTFAGNSSFAVGTSILYGSIDSVNPCDFSVPWVFRPAPQDGEIPIWDVRGNWWGTATPDPARVASGWVDLSSWCVRDGCLPPPSERPSRRNTQNESDEELLSGVTQVNPAPAPRPSELFSLLARLNAQIRALPLPEAAINVLEGQLASVLVGGESVTVRIVPTEEVVANAASLFQDSEVLALGPNGDTLLFSNLDAAGPVEVNLADVKIIEIGTLRLALVSLGDSEGERGRNDEGELVVQPDDRLVAVANGLPPGVVFRAFFFSTPTDLGSVVADGNGEVLLEGTLPADTAPGDHTLQLVTGTEDGEIVQIAIPINVAEPVAETAEELAPEPEPATEDEVAAVEAEAGFSIPWFIWLIVAVVVLGVVIALVVAGVRSRRA